jgi:hypothetical protein
MAFPPVASRPLLAIAIALLVPILLYVLVVVHIAAPRAAECAKRDGVISSTPPPGCHMIGSHGCPRKLRVALLFSGQPRHVDGIAYEAYSRCVLDRGFAVDVFAFFWRDGGGDGKDASSIVDFARLYHPVAVETATPIPPEVYLRGRTYPRQYDYPATRDKTMKNHMSMYTAMANVFSLWRNVSAALGREYDILIRARSDGVWAACPDLGWLDPDYLYGPNWYPGLPNLVNHILVLPGRDAAAPGSIAHTVFNIRDAIDEMYDEGVFIADENLMFALVDRSGFKNRTRLIGVSQYDPGITRDGMTVLGAVHCERNVPGVVWEPPGGYQMTIPTVSRKACQKYGLELWQQPPPAQPADRPRRPLVALLAVLLVGLSVLQVLLASSSLRWRVRIGGWASGR